VDMRVEREAGVEEGYAPTVEIEDQNRSEMKDDELPILMFEVRRFMFYILHFTRFYRIQIL